MTPVNLITIQEAVNQIKLCLEAAIICNGEIGKLALIRSQKPIKLIHEAVKSSLIKNGVDPAQIYPKLGSSRGEVRAAGFLKRKAQDISVFPSSYPRSSEDITSGLLTGQTDVYGKKFTERILSINVRSQLSSSGKNFDTLYERTFAEALNLHLRCPKMCLGEVYMIPVYEYDTKAAQKHKIGFSKSINKLDKYLMAFNAIAERTSVSVDHYKYEKVCLLVVDFNQSPPKIYNSDQELKAHALLQQNSSVSIKNLIFDNFASSLIKAHKSRFPGII